MSVVLRFNADSLWTLAVVQRRVGNGLKWLDGFGLPFLSEYNGHRCACIERHQDVFTDPVFNVFGDSVIDASRHWIWTQGPAAEYNLVVYKTKGFCALFVLLLGTVFADFGDLGVKDLHNSGIGRREPIYVGGKRRVLTHYSPRAPQTSSRVNNGSVSDDDTDSVREATFSALHKNAYTVNSFYCVSRFFFFALWLGEYQLVKQITFRPFYVRTSICRFYRLCVLLRDNFTVILVWYL